MGLGIHDLSAKAVLACGESDGLNYPKGPWVVEEKLIVLQCRLKKMAKLNYKLLNNNRLKKVVGPAGLEPATNGL